MGQMPLMSQGRFGEMQMPIDACLGEIQNDFCKSRQASDLVFVLRRTVEEAKAWGGELTLVKLDDTIAHSSMLVAVRCLETHLIYKWILAREPVTAEINMTLHQI